MNKLKLLFLLLILWNGQTANSQSKWWVLPGALVGLGVLANNQSVKNLQTEIYNQSFSNFHTRIDDGLQYAPTLINIGLHIGSNQRKALVGKFIIGSIAYAGLTQGLKHSLQISRPNGGENSFPSGHAATAFFGAHLLAKEFSQEKPWVPYLGYGLATSTAFLRMANNQHWMSDVLVGAGIGIGAAEFSTYLYPILEKKWQKKHAYTIEPVIGNQVYAMRIAWQLN